MLQLLWRLWLAVPGTVTDLTVVTATDTTLALRWTEVASGALSPANYDIRVGPTAAGFAWWLVGGPASGSCKATQVGTSVGGGTVRFCIIGGLLPSTSYSVQMVAFTGTLNQGAVFGPLSNVAVGVTAATPPPIPPPPPPALQAPTSVTFDSLRVRGDTAWLYPRWSPVGSASGYLLTYGITATNGAWTNTGVRTVSGGAATSWESNIQSTTADSALFRACVRATTATQVSDSACSAPRQWRRASAPPPPSTVTFVDVSPIRVSVPVGDRANVRAFPYVTGGRVALDSVRWSVADAAIARVLADRVSQFAMVTAQQPGSTFVRATVGGVFGQIRFVVTPAPPLPAPAPDTLGVLVWTVAGFPLPVHPLRFVWGTSELPLADSTGKVVGTAVLTVRKP